MKAAEQLKWDVRRLLHMRTEARLGTDTTFRYDSDLMSWWATMTDVVFRTPDAYAVATQSLTILDRIIDEHPEWNRGQVVQRLNLELNGVTYD